MGWLAERERSQLSYPQGSYKFTSHIQSMLQGNFLPLLNKDSRKR